MLLSVYNSLIDLVAAVVYNASNRNTYRAGIMRAPYNERPLCTTLGCTNRAAMIQDYYDGTANWRKYCSRCHNARTAAKHGLSTILEITARRAGFNTVTEFLNSKHPYRAFRKTYCENVDSRLGFKCTTTVVWDGMLDVDHIDGNPANNAEENLQTLCKCCHAYKTSVNKDYLTPGRKAIGVTY